MQVPERLVRVVEEHDAEARDDAVEERTSEVGAGGVAHHEADVREARLAGALATGGDQRRRDVQPGDRTARGDESRHLQACRAGTAADVEDLLARSEGRGREQPGTCRGDHALEARVMGQPPIPHRAGPEFGFARLSSSIVQGSVPLRPAKIAAGTRGYHQRSTWDNNHTHGVHKVLAMADGGPE